MWLNQRRFLFAQVCLLVSVMTLMAKAQSSVAVDKIVDCSATSHKSPKNNPKSKIISAGVVNGKSVNLINPEYPVMSRVLGVRGSVQIQVIIDESGCVSETTALSGHPVLIPAALRAAKLSSFFPTLVGDTPVRVYGVIVYNYLPNSMNWLELGFFSDSYESIMEYLPVSFDRERKLLEQSKALSYSERQNILGDVLNSVSADLTSDQKNLWLFSIGRNLKALKNQVWEREGRKRILLELGDHMESVPTEASPHLTIRLTELIAEPDYKKLSQHLKELEDRFFDLGN